MSQNVTVYDGEMEINPDASDNMYNMAIRSTQAPAVEAFDASNLPFFNASRIRQSSLASWVPTEASAAESASESHPTRHHDDVKQSVEDNASDDDDAGSIGDRLMNRLNLAHPATKPKAKVVPKPEAKKQAKAKAKATASGKDSTTKSNEKA